MCCHRCLSYCIGNVNDNNNNNNNNNNKGFYRLSYNYDYWFEIEKEMMEMASIQQVLLRNLVHCEKVHNI